MLCLSGDHQKFGNQAQGKNVFDIDSMPLLRTVTDMTEKDVHRRCVRDGCAAAGDPFAGAAENPFADPFEYRAARLEKKIDEREVHQTQCVFNLEKFATWMKEVRKRGCASACTSSAGVTPLKSAGMARYMRDKVAGMDVPESSPGWTSSRFEARAEGITIWCNNAELRKASPACTSWQSNGSGCEIVEKAGLLPRP